MRSGPAVDSTLRIAPKVLREPCWHRWGRRQRQRCRDIVKKHSDSTLGRRVKRKVRTATFKLWEHHSFQPHQVPPRIWKQIRMTWHCRPCQTNNSEKNEYCVSCNEHWSTVWHKAKRRSRSKSTKASTAYRDAGSKEDSQSVAQEWNVFPSNAPWIPSTPTARTANKKVETTDGAGVKEAAEQMVLQPDPASVAGEVLTPEEQKILQHLRGLQEMKMQLPDGM